MILKSENVPAEQVDGSMPRVEQRIAQAGRLPKMGVNIVTLMPGTTSSQRHWHEIEDEFLYMLEGEATVIENDGEHIIGPGDMCCWPGGVANAHHLKNHSDQPVRYLIIGSGAPFDRVHYPDEGQLLHNAPPRWWVEDAVGNIVREGLTD